MPPESIVVIDINDVENQNQNQNQNPDIDLGQDFYLPPISPLFTDPDEPYPQNTYPLDAADETILQDVFDKESEDMFDMFNMNP